MLSRTGRVKLFTSHEVYCRSVRSVVEALRESFVEVSSRIAMIVRDFSKTRKNSRECRGTIVRARSVCKSTMHSRNGNSFPVFDPKKHSRFPRILFPFRRIVRLSIATRVAVPVFLCSPRTRHDLLAKHFSSNAQTQITSMVAIVAWCKL